MTMEESADFILSMRNIRVQYQDLQALKGVDFDLRAGEVHAVVGEHRAGKSSLVGILSGAVQPAGGEILLFGKRLSGLSPKQAMSNRIAIVYQYTSIIPSLSAAENLFAGRFPLGCFHTLRFSPMLAEAKRVFSDMGVKVDLKTPVGFLSKAEQHMVELARALLLSPSILSPRRDIEQTHATGDGDRLPQHPRLQEGGEEHHQYLPQHGRDLRVSPTG
jgi:ABC-type sugar transport system ATPase subunit